MMLVVADSNDPQRTRQPAQQPDQNAPEPIDAEIVDEQPAAGTQESRRSGPRDDEEFQQYQQFLEFQKFQEWKRQQGDDVPGSSGPDRPWWKKALRLLGRFKLLRRLVYVFVALLLLWGYIVYNYSDSGGDEGGPSGGGVPGNENPKQAPVLSTDPKQAVVAIYTYQADTPDVTCELFSEAGKAQFARDNGAPDCPAAAQKLHAQVTNPTTYANPKFGENAVSPPSNGMVDVSSCQILVDGGPRLGTFVLKQNVKGGWVIDGHQNEPADCVTG